MGDVIRMVKSKSQLESLLSSAQEAGSRVRLVWAEGAQRYCFRCREDGWQANVGVPMRINEEWWELDDPLSFAFCLERTNEFTPWVVDVELLEEGP